MNTEGIPGQALKRKKTRRLKRRRLQDYKKMNVNETPSKKVRKQPAAPENTTQFLMEDREQLEPIDFVCSPANSTSSSCCCSNSTSSVRGSPVDERDFDYCSDIEENFDQVYFENDFNNVYDNIQAETLFELTKQELINRYLNLEKREEELLKRVKSISSDEGMDTSFVDLSSVGDFTVSKNNKEMAANGSSCRSACDHNSLVSQLQELRNVNSQLIQENERLRGC